jgi:KaiC/GvpD/RAD55 family RecA-like ATPase
MIEVTRTGVDGLDSILDGGIPKQATVLVSGSPGTGKSILGIQYLYNGVSECDQKGIYLSFEENASDIADVADSLGFEDWEEYVDGGDIQVHDKRELLQDENFTETLDRLLEEFQQSDYERLVLDSLTMFELFFDDEAEKRRYLLKFSDILKENGLTSLFISEQRGIFPNEEIGLENFLTDGNIYLIQAPMESGVNRFIWIAKMRKQEIETDVFPMEISTGGITVYDSASGFSLIDDGGNGFLG